ncbi:MAG: hypothetical protein COA69_00285 [Robiginitomaculum sp.]|nr:MAG: hypothetical protein COA69_00285 [Robiginitomaculum sp.]
MLKNRPLMMLLTGVVLALVLWGLVSVVQTNETPSTSVGDVEANTINDEYMISPASVLSIEQFGARFVLEGTGVAGAGLSLLHGERVLGTTKLNSAGEWTFSFTQTVLPDVMELALLMTTPDGHQVRSDQSLLLIKGLEVEFEDIPVEMDQTLVPAKALILLSAPGAGSRVLQTLYEDLPGQDGFILEAIDYDNSGGVIFSGLSLRQGKVTIYANGNPVGESRVDTTGRWSLIFGNIMPMGAYDIGVELVSDTGQNPIALTLPFERMAPMFETENSPKILVQRLDDRIQIARALYGGGYQFTVVYAPSVFLP